MVRKGTKIELKVRKSNESLKKIEEQVQNFNENMRNRNYETKQLETLYFIFRETIETRRNSGLFRTVSFFAKLKRNETVHPSRAASCIKSFILGYKGARESVEQPAAQYSIEFEEYTLVTLFL